MKIEKRTIGRIDILDFPKLDLFEIDVKIDTGAFTSSFHCHYIEEIEKEGETVLSCKFLDPDHPNYNNRAYYFNNYQLKNVKSSNGIVEKRYSIETEVNIFGQSLPIELTLAERGSMKYSILLGRKFLNKRFIVDTARTNLSHKAIKIKK